MDYLLLGRSGLRVSELCLGTMTFGEEWGFGSSEAESRAVFDRFAEGRLHVAGNLESILCILGECFHRDFGQAIWNLPGWARAPRVGNGVVEVTQYDARRRVVDVG